MKNLVLRLCNLKRINGFTLVELLITMSILGILSAIAIPAVGAYIDKAKYAAMRVTLDFVMDGEDMHLAESETFYPERGAINIPEGSEKEIPEIAYTFPKGHDNRYMIYGYNYNRARWNYNLCYIYVWADFDANDNGYDDIYIMLTYYYNGEARYNRELMQFR